MKLLAASALAIAASSAYSQSFVNGDFETGTLAGWTITPTTNGQASVQTVEVFDIDGGGPLSATNAGKFSVGQVTPQAGVPAGIELTQILALTGGITYNIRFDLAAVRTTATNNAQGGIFDLIVDGTSLANFAAGGTSSATPHYSSLSADFLAPVNGNYVVGVRIQRPFTIPGFGGAETLFQYVDNFQSTVVPEPATFIALGFGAVLLLARRRR